MVRTLIVAMALALLAPAAWADDVKPSKPIEKNKIDKDNPLDRDFLIAVAQCNTNEIDCLTAFEKLTSSDKVKQFAKEVKKDHDDLQKEIATAFEDRKIGVVATPDKDTVSKLNELRKMDKSERDKAFLDHFIAGHEKALKMAEHQKEKGKDDDAKKIAEKMIPELKEHIKKAKDLKKELK